MPAGRSMPNRVVVALLALAAGTGAAAAQRVCAPHCDYAHYYGPYDFTYAQPGLYGNPVCDEQGNCAPNLVYHNVLGPVRKGRITVRLLRSAPRRP